MRTYVSTRALLGTEQSRGRIFALIDHEPVLVNVYRYPAGSGVTGPKTLALVATFIGRLEESRKIPSVVATEAYTNYPVQWLLVALKENDALDGVSGSTVDIKADDRVTITDENTTVGTFTVTGVQALRSHIEATLQQRT